MSGMRRNWILMIGVAIGASVALFAGSPNVGFSRAEELYQRTEYRAAIDALELLDQKNAASYALLGKAYFMQDQHKEAIASLERAVSEDSRNSDYHDWLGRAYGRLAERSSFITAIGHAKKTVREFERAVDLDASNLEALSDLFEFYLQAPGMVGGGMDKAENLARRMAGFHEAEGHWARARIAEKRKDWVAAEREFRAAWEAAPNQVGRALDVATFLSSRGRYSESDAVFRAAEEKYPNAPKVLFARAAAYVHSKRMPGEARALVHRYLEAQITPDDPPRREALALLTDLACNR
jgi:tetratricopeptide (TPR) repeat protein